MDEFCADHVRLIMNSYHGDGIFDSPRPDVGTAQRNHPHLPEPFSRIGLSRSGIVQQVLEESWPHDRFEFRLSL